MSSLLIPTHELDNFGKDFVFVLDQAWLDQAFAEIGVRGVASEEESRVAVHAQMNGREVLVHGKAKAKLVTECGRCLKDLPLSVSCDLAALYTHGVRPHKDSEEEELEDIDPEEPDREYYTGDHVAIDDLVRDYLLLELPMQVSCELGWACPNLDVPEEMRGPEGVHSAQGFGEGDIDPRLLPLMKLAKGEREKE